MRMAIGVKIDTHNIGAAASMSSLCNAKTQRPQRRKEIHRIVRFAPLRLCAFALNTKQTAR
jgi:hypothetical protein